VILSFSKESRAETIASLALFSPEETADPMIAVPLLDKTVLHHLNLYFEYSDALLLRQYLLRLLNFIRF
jgi:hypothetical protein